MVGGEVRREEVRGGGNRRGGGEDILEEGGEGGEEEEVNEGGRDWGEGDVLVMLGLGRWFGRGVSFFRRMHVIAFMVLSL